LSNSFSGVLLFSDLQPLSRRGGGDATRPDRVHTSRSAAAVGEEYGTAATIHSLFPMEMGTGATIFPCFIFLKLILFFNRRMERQLMALFDYWVPKFWILDAQSRILAVVCLVDPKF
jgi:hypothetical protein